MPLSNNNATNKRRKVLKEKARPAKSKAYADKKFPQFCKNVRSRRIQLGLSQASLGEKIGIPDTRITELESGRFPSDPDRVVALAKALDCTLDWLFGVDDAGAPSPYVRAEVISEIEEILQPLEYFNDGDRNQWESADEAIDDSLFYLKSLISDWEKRK